MKKQLLLDLEIKPIARQQKHYLDLSIDKKINVKANSGGWEMIWLLNSRCGYNKHSGFIGYRDITDFLTKKYFEHYYLNHGSRPYPIKNQLF